MSCSSYIVVYIALFSLFRSDGHNTDLVQAGVYRYVRHPMYTGVIWSLLKYANELNLSFLLSIQSVGHLLVSCVTSLYVILAVRYFEEPALVKSMSTILEIQCCLVEYVIAC